MEKLIDWQNLNECIKICLYKKKKNLAPRVCHQGKLSFISQLWANRKKHPSGLDNCLMPHVRLLNVKEWTMVCQASWKWNCIGCVSHQSIHNCLRSCCVVFLFLYDEQRVLHTLTYKSYCKFMWIYKILHCSVHP